MVTSKLLAFVAAERREFSGFLANAERVVKLDWPLPFARMVWLNGRAAVLVANGPGPRLAGQAADVAREHEELKGLVSTGYCGALDPALKLCDIFVATAVLSAATEFPSTVLPAILPGRDRQGAVPQPLAQAPSSVRTGKLLSLNRVVSTSAEKTELRQTGADAVEMEAAAVATRAQEWNQPFYCIRVVTDTAQESFPLDFNRMRDAEGRFSRSKIMAAALLRPTVFPKMMKLNRRCNDASKALGDFIASCRF
jgi:adenosylhomocysteine nucleosidase